MHLARLKGGVRRVMRISEITGLENDDYQIQDIFRFQQAGLDSQGRAAGRFQATGNVPAVLDRLEELGIPVSPRLFDPRPLSGIETVSFSSQQEVPL